ncbi:MAG: hypothetical protein ACRC8A_05690 [Microcoleaceae cyanobacterium]
MIDPLFWLGLSLLLVAVSLTAVLVAVLPAVQAISRAASSLEKLADTLSREFPPTLEAIRMTGLEISELTDDVSQGVQQAGQVVKQVDRSLDGARKQAQRVQHATDNLFTGIQVAWRTFTRKSPPTLAERHSLDRLPGGQEPISAPPVRERSLKRIEDKDFQDRGNPELYEDSLGRQPYYSDAEAETPVQPWDKD